MGVAGQFRGWQFAAYAMYPPKFPQAKTKQFNLIENEENPMLSWEHLCSMVCVRMHSKGQYSELKPLPIFFTFVLYSFKALTCVISFKYVCFPFLA